MLNKLNSWIPWLLKAVAAITALWATINGAQANVVGVDVSELWKIALPAGLAATAMGGVVVHRKLTGGGDPNLVNWEADALSQLADLDVMCIKNRDTQARDLLKPVIDHFCQTQPGT